MSTGTNGGDTHHDLGEQFSDWLTNPWVIALIAAIGMVLGHIIVNGLVY